MSTPATTSFPLWGGTAVLMVTDPAALGPAESVLRELLAAVDRACSRFREDSQIRYVERLAAPTPVGTVLAEVVTAALRVARATGGLVDPTVGTALDALGYDRDFAAIAPDLPNPPVPRPAPGWRRVGWDPQRRLLFVPAGTRIDLGAVGKAWAADRAAALIARRYGVGALVSLGGDLAVAGTAPDGGWRIWVGADHERAGPDDVLVTVTDGGLATSGITRRAWRRAGRVVHHIVDPRTGLAAEPVWRTVSVAAAHCVDANAASTAAIIRGVDAPDWLAGVGLPARLTGVDGRVRTVAGWPAVEPVVAR